MKGHPLATAVVSCRNIDDSVRFYRDVIGLEAGAELVWAGAVFERHWHLQRGSEARAARMRGLDSVGQILLLEFDSQQREQVREASTRTWYGLYNLNFYTPDIAAATKEMAMLGYPSWTEPVHHEISASAGAPTEVLIEGPDGVLINLVQLPAERGSAAGDLAELVAPLRTRNGFTAVCTSAHRVKDLEAALDFHQKALGLETLIDAFLSRPETNRLLNLPVHARTHSMFLWSGHPLGKVVLSNPVNYTLPDLVDRAVAPNIGYLAMSFEVDDLQKAITLATVYSEPEIIDIPGIGPRDACIVRCPGSGALLELVDSA
jgi:catechol 2,3-dioxygenase-like lactoylglutathione lyase family enzyme